MHGDGAETLRVGLSEGGSNGIHSTPLALPLDMPGAFQFTDPVFAHTFDKARQFQCQDPIIKRLIRVGEMAFLFQLLCNLQRNLRPLLIAHTV